MAKQGKECRHLDVSARLSHGDWQCRDCGEQFIPMSEAGDMIAAQVIDQADMVASVASAMLWDFHERAVQRYGKDSPQAKAVEAERVEGESEMFEYTPETCPAHEWSGAQCALCGSPKWLGA
jgi:hypothetical protein